MSARAAIAGDCTAAECVAALALGGRGQIVLTLDERGVARLRVFFDGERHFDIAGADAAITRAVASELRLLRAWTTSDLPAPADGAAAGSISEEFS